MIHRCTFRSTEDPDKDGWAWIWISVVDKEGFYCKPHADALDELAKSGQLDAVLSGETVRQSRRAQKRKPRNE